MKTRTVGTPFLPECFLLFIAEYIVFKMALLLWFKGEK
jgi:hypothetical protein